MLTERGENRIDQSIIDLPVSGFNIIKIEDEKVIETLENIRSLDESANNYEIKVMSLIYKLWDSTLSYLEKKNIPRKKLIPDTTEENLKRALDFISSHYGEKITISEIAEASFMSRNSLFRHFKTSFGRTPLEVLLEKRLNTAAALLEKDMSITEVSSLSGFNTSSYFIKSFRDRFGETPGEYRRRKRQQHGH